MKYLNTMLSSGFKVSGFGLWKKLLKSSKNTKHETRNIIFFSILILISVTLSSLGQTSTSSPYSRYGLGELSSTNFTQNRGMGGISVAMPYDTLAPFSINIANPASYSFIKLTTFDIGITGNAGNLNSSTKTTSYNNIAFDHVAFGIPVSKNWGLSFGLLPYSSVGYNITDEQTITNIGQVNYEYTGTGGINKLFVGNAFKPLGSKVIKYKASKEYKDLLAAKKDSLAQETLRKKANASNFSIGFNAYYLFGKTDYTRRSIFPSTYFGFNTRSTGTIRVNDVAFDMGIQHVIQLRKNNKITYGITYGLNKDVSAKSSVLTVSYLKINYYDLVKDTIENVSDIKGVETLPFYYSAGITFSKGEKFMIGAEYSHQNWIDFASFGVNQGLANSDRFALGAQYVNDLNTITGSIFSRMIYRAGLNYANTPLLLKNIQLKEYSVTAGLGIPLYNPTTKNLLPQFRRNLFFTAINLAAEFGVRGTTDQNLIQEQFIKFHVGLTINDRWFVKPKID